MTVQRQPMTCAVLAAILLVGSACGQLASTDGAETVSVDRSGEANAGLDAPVDEETEGPSVRIEPVEVVETVDLVPVAPASAAPEETGGDERLVGGIYDVAVRVDVSEFDGSVEEARLMMASGGETSDTEQDGETSDGEPVPLPAYPGAGSEGGTFDGEPVPLPADEDDDSEDSEEENEPRMFEVQGALLIIFPNLQIPPGVEGNEVSVVLSGESWTRTVSLDV